MLNIHDSKRSRRAIGVAALAVDQGRVEGTGGDHQRNSPRKPLYLRDRRSIRRKIVVPIPERDNGSVWKNLRIGERDLPRVFPTVVNVVQMLLRVIWIIDDQSTTQPIAVLGPEVAVIPVCTLKWIELSLSISCKMNKENYILVRNREVIHKAFVWYNGTLCDISRTIGVVGVLLEDAMPML